MNRILSTFAIFSPLATIAVVDPAQAAFDSSNSKKNYVAPTIGFPSGITLLGLQSKFGVADNISVRPFIQFASASTGPVSGSITAYGGTVTYDLPIPKSDFAPYAGVGVIGTSAGVSVGGFSVSGSTTQFMLEVGSDYNVSDSIALNANYRFNNVGYFSIGGGYRF